MALSAEQVTLLKTEIDGYSFTPHYFDFNTGAPVVAPNMAVVEYEIYHRLTSPIALEVKHGLANVIF